MRALSDAIPGVSVSIDREAIVVASMSPLTTVSSAVAGGGFVKARTLLNLHVPKNLACEPPEQPLIEFMLRQGLPMPFVGFLTAAWTEKAEVAYEAAHGVTALVVVTVGLSHPVAAGLSPCAAVAVPSTINTIVVVDADATPAALVNAALTVTEAKTAALIAQGVLCRDGAPASGTSTDAVAVAATGRGRSCRYAGPVSDLGWVVARAARSALEAGICRWLDEHALDTLGAPAALEPQFLRRWESRVIL